MPKAPDTVKPTSIAEPIMDMVPEKNTKQAWEKDAEKGPVGGTQNWRRGRVRNSDANEPHLIEQVPIEQRAGTVHCECGKDVPAGGINGVRAFLADWMIFDIELHGPRGASFILRGAYERFGIDGFRAVFEYIAERNPQIARMGRAKFVPYIESLHRTAMAEGKLKPATMNHGG